MQRTPLFLILVTVFIALVGFGIVIPLLPVYAEQYGASGVTVGFLMMTYSLMQFLLAPLAGKISDKIGRRPIIIISLAITTGSYILFGLADSLTLLFVSRIFAGIGGADITVAQAYIADVTPPEKRAKGMGLFGAAFGVGFIVGPVLGGLLAPFGQAVPAFTAAAFAGVTTIWAIWKLPEPEKHRGKVQRSLSFMKSMSGGVSGVVLLQFLTVFVQSQLQSMLVLFNVHNFSWTARENGYYLGLIGFTAVIVQGGLIGTLVRKYGERTLVWIGLILIGSGMYMISKGDVLSWLIVGGIVNALGFASVLPSLSSLVSQRAPKDKQGQVLGVFQSAGSLGRILAPISGGLLYDHLAPSAPFSIGSVLAVMTAILAFVVLRKLPSHHADTTIPPPTSF
ncbi:MFS transporter [bacterium]|nr:MFS transporter [bacterium]